MIKWPWSKREPELLETEPKQRKRESLSQTAERIIQKRMKDDPTGYGIRMAEKLKRVAKEEEKKDRSMSSELKEFKALYGLLKELGHEMSSGEGGKGIVSQILEALVSLPQTLAQLQSMQGQMPQQGISQSPYIVTTQEQPQLRQPEPQPEEQPQQTPLSLSELEAYLDSEPSEAVSALSELNPGWLNMLANSEPQGVVNLIRGFTMQKPELMPLVERLSSESGQEWLKSCISVAKLNLNQGEMP